MDSIRVLDIDIDCITRQELLKSLHSGVLFTPNVDHLVTLHDDSDFLDCYRLADYRVCDSRVLRLCSLLLPRAIPEAIPGSSFFHEYCFYHAADNDCRLFLIFMNIVSIMLPTMIVACSSSAQPRVWLKKLGNASTAA